MERGKDKKNILIAGLLVIVFAMSVGFAFLSSNLNIEATGTISGDWNVKFRPNSLEVLEKTTGVNDTTTQINSDNMSVTLNASFEKPGEKISYEVYIDNQGNLDGILDSVTLTGDEDNTSVIKLSYEVYDNDKTTLIAKGSITGNTPVEDSFTQDTYLAKKSGDVVDYNYVTIRLEYLENTTATSSESATYTLALYYRQPEVTVE